MPKKRSSSWLLTLLSIAWAAGTLLLCWFDPEIADALWFLSFILWGPVWLAGLALAALALLRLTRRALWWQGAIPLLLTIPLLILMIHPGTDWLYYTRIQAVEIPRHYAPEVDKLMAMTPEQRKNLDRKRLNFDEGPPLRIAFVEPGGILDNWSAIVYDPTDLVRKANNATMATLHDPKHASYVKLFGGDLYGVEPLGGHWYRCFFT